MPIPRDEPVRGCTREPHDRQIQHDADESPCRSAVDHRAGDAPTAAVGATVIDEIGRRLHILDGQAELSEIVECLERHEFGRCTDALLEPGGPLPTEAAIAIKDEQPTIHVASG